MPSKMTDIHALVEDLKAAREAQQRRVRERDKHRTPELERAVYNGSYEIAALEARLAAAKKGVESGNL